jgi:hypothetical protein
MPHEAGLRPAAITSFVVITANVFRRVFIPCQFALPSVHRNSDRQQTVRIDMWSSSQPLATASLQLPAGDDNIDELSSSQRQGIHSQSQHQWASAELQPMSEQHADDWQSQQPGGAAADGADFTVSGTEVLNRLESCTLWFLSHLRDGSIPDLQLVRHYCCECKITVQTVSIGTAIAAECYHVPLNMKEQCKPTECCRSLLVTSLFIVGRKESQPRQHERTLRQ